MSDTSQGQGWWLASDRKWYPPELHASYLATLAPPTAAMPVPVPYPPGYGPPPGLAGPGVAAPPAHQRIDGLLSLPLAPWWKRLVALLVDVAIVAVPYCIVIAFIAGLQSQQVTYSTSPPGAGPPFFSNAIGIELAVLLYSIPYLVYAAAMNGSRRGQTLGKMAMHIAVRDSRSGEPIGFWRGVGRYLMTYVLWAVFFIPGILDSLTPLWDGRRQALHDKVAHSVVVDLDR